MVTIIVSIALVGLVCWLVTTFVPMPPAFAKAIYAVAGVGLLLWVLNVLGLWSGFDLPRGRLR